jgi:hypothetical protein
MAMLLLPLRPSTMRKCGVITCHDHLGHVFVEVSQKVEPRRVVVQRDR